MQPLVHDPSTTYTFLPEPTIIYIAILVVLSFVKGCVHLSFEKNLKMICYQKNC
jgi:hypothetical protein